MRIRINGGASGRIVLPGGGTCTAIIDFSNDSGPERYYVEVLHTVTAPDMPIIRIVQPASDRFVRIAQICLDCSGPATTVPPDDGFDAAVMVIHDSTCPLYGSAVRTLRKRGAR